MKELYFVENEEKPPSVPAAIGGMKHQINILLEERLLGVSEEQRLYQSIEGNKVFLLDVIGVLDRHLSAFLSLLFFDLLRCFPHVGVHCTLLLALILVILIRLVILELDDLLPNVFVIACDNDEFIFWEHGQLTSYTLLIYCFVVARRGSPGAQAKSSLKQRALCNLNN